MNEQSSPALVGAFVLGLGALLVAGVLWLAAGWGHEPAADLYQAFIEESVAGLSVDAPVKYLGVDVGKVSQIDLDPRNSRQVRLRFLIHRGTPVKQDSLAVLKTQGLTGIAYVELSGGTPGARAMAANPDGEPPTIAFKLSLGARLESVLSGVLTQVDGVTTRLNAVLDDDNRAALKALLTDAAAVAHGLAAQRDTVSAVLRDAARTARGSARAVEQLPPEVSRTLARIDASAAAVQQLADTAGAASVQVGRAAQQVEADSLPELGRLMAELTQLSESLRQLSDQTRAAPASLIRGRPQLPLGPGERTPP